LSRRNKSNPHEERKLINKYWAEVTGIPLEQFRGIVYKKTINKKVYAKL